MASIASSLVPPEELDALRRAFDAFDSAGSGAIPSSKVEEALSAAGRDPATAVIVLRTFDPDRTGYVSFDQFVTMAASKAMAAGPPPAETGPSSPTALLGKGGAVGRTGDTARSSTAFSATGGSAAGGGASAGLDEGPDPKVEEFLRVLEEYRVKCEGEGNYEEAARATDQLELLRRQEEARRIRALKARHVAERAEVAAAHNAQYAEFNAAWDRYLSEYDAMAAMYVSQMQERHGAKLRDFQAALHGELLKRPVKFSKELLDWRGREALLAKQKKYGDAARIKAVADKLERKERAASDEERLALFTSREVKFRQQQGAELSALLKRIDTRRSEHVKQREIDSKRLLQRNRNVMAVLENRQAAEEARKIAEIKMSLAPMRITAATRTTLLAESAAKSGSILNSSGAGSSPVASARKDAAAAAKAGGASARSYVMKGQQQASPRRAAK